MSTRADDHDDRLDRLREVGATRREQYLGRRLDDQQCSTAADRFWGKVDRSGGDGSCWLWTGAQYANGYGNFGICAGKNVVAHRYAYILSVGDPGSLHVLHNCPTGDNPLCCNPRHLWAGTQAENMADMRRKGRSRAGDRNLQAKLTLPDVEAIREMLGSGAAQKAIAETFGVSQSTISNIHRGLNWTDPNRPGCRDCRYWEPSGNPRRRVCSVWCIEQPARGWCQRFERYVETGSVLGRNVNHRAR